MTKTVVLVRLEHRPDRTLGKLIVFDGLYESAYFYSLELPWSDNQRNVSRIPAGKYNIEPRKSTRLGDCFAVLDVPGRDAILVHTGNTPDDIRGCILIGMRVGDIDRDGIPDVVSSRAAIGLMSQCVPGPAHLVVVDA